MSEHYSWLLTTNLLQQINLKTKNQQSKRNKKNRERERERKKERERERVCVRANLVRCKPWERNSRVFSKVQTIRIEFCERDVIIGDRLLYNQFY